MTQVRRVIKMEGVEVVLIFTPRLYTFKGVQGVDFQADAEDVNEVMSLYADVMFCAYLNHLTLTGGNAEDARFTRVNFHEWAATEPKDFARAVDFALQALTGKRLADYMAEAKEPQEKPEIKLKPVKKKTSLSIIRRLRRFWSGSAD